MEQQTIGEQGEQQQCVFCQIASGGVASRKVYEDDKVVAVLDINPANPGHLLLITKEHHVIMPQIPDALTEHIGMIAKGLSHALLKALKVQGTNIFVANGMVAGQRAQHFMLHIIPRMEKDGLQFKLPEHAMRAEQIELLQKAFKGEKVEQKAPAEEKPEKKKKKTKKKASKKEPAEEKKPSLDDITNVLLGK